MRPQDKTTIYPFVGGILYPSLEHKFVVYFSPHDRSTVNDWDGRWVSDQVTDVSYSLSTRMVTLNIEEPRDLTEALTALVKLPDVIQTITIVNNNNFPASGVALFGLTLDNHFVERSYGKNGAVVHKFRFKFENIEATTINGVAD